MYSDSALKKLSNYGYNDIHMFIIINPKRACHPREDARAAVILLQNESVFHIIDSDSIIVSS